MSTNFTTRLRPRLNLTTLFSKTMPAHHLIDHACADDTQIYITRKHKTFVEHLYNVVSMSMKLGRRCTNAMQMICVCWKSSII